MSRPVVRVGDFIMPHVCKEAVPHATPFISGSLSVLTNGRPTVTFGSFSLCRVMAIPGHSSILVNVKPIAVMGSPTTPHIPSIVNGKLANVTTGSITGSGGEVINFKQVDFVPCATPSFCAMGSLSVLANVKGA